MAFKNVHEGTPGVLLLARLLGLQAGVFCAENFKSGDIIHTEHEQVTFVRVLSIV